MSIYIPTVTKAKTAKTVTKTIAAKLDLPEPGTLMRATLGFTSIVFRIEAQNPNADLNDRLFYGRIEGAGHSGFRTITFWTDVPWTFEILDDEATS